MKVYKILSLALFTISIFTFFNYLSIKNSFEEVVDQYTRTISHLGVVDSGIKKELKRKYDIDVSCPNSCSAYVGESITVIFTKNNYLINTNIVMNVLTCERYIIMGLIY